MGRVLRVTLLALLLTACGGSNFSAPRNLNDACSIAQERPKYMRAMRAAERKWGVPVPVQMATIYQESKFIGNARTPNRYLLGVIPMGRVSTAYGYAQALDGTWAEYQKETGGRWAKRDRIDDAADFVGWYMDKTARLLGIAKSDTRNQYLAYHDGRAGYARASYQKKPWLVAVAGRVADRAVMYDDQLRACGR